MAESPAAFPLHLTEGFAGIWAKSFWCCALASSLAEVFACAGDSCAC